MKLQTIVNVVDLPFKIEPLSKVLVMGSCFAESMGEKLSALEGVLKNPFGVIYNPLSMVTCIDALYNGRIFNATDLEFRNGLYHSFLHHGSFSHPTIGDTLRAINAPSATEFDIIMLTLGTAYVYERNGAVVSNCHKFPESEFYRRRATTGQCSDALQTIASLYPTAKFILTVSPIRHLRDGLDANFVSKATLRMAIDDFINANPNRAAYFQSYEILMDELRDYRFTAPDMCHPTAQATDYIYNIFEQSAIAPSAAAIIAQAERAKKQSAHRPLH